MTQKWLFNVILTCGNFFYLKTWLILLVPCLATLLISIFHPNHNGHCPTETMTVKKLLFMLCYYHNDNVSLFINLYFVAACRQ